MTATERGLEFSLPPLKARAIDPLVMMEGVPIRYSDVEPSYRAYLAGQKATMAKGYNAVVLMRPDVAKRITDSSDRVTKEWEEIIQRGRNTAFLGRKVLDSIFDNQRSRFDTFF